MFSSILLFCKMFTWKSMMHQDCLFEIEIYDKKTTKEMKNFFKIHTFCYRFPILWRFLLSTIRSCNFSPEALLWIHRFTSCNAILSWDKKGAALPACVPLLSRIPFFLSKRKTEKHDDAIIWCLGMWDLRVSKCFWKQSLADPSSCYLLCYLLGRIARFSRKRLVQ